MRPFIVGVLVVLMHLASAGLARASVFRIDFPSLERTYAYGDASPVVPINLGTRLRALSSIQVELQGVNTMGYWVDSWDPSGPKSGQLHEEMNRGNPWETEYVAPADGPFATTASLYRVGGGTDWSFLADGITDFYVWNVPLGDLFVRSEPLGGVDFFYFTTPPSYTLTHVAVVIDATPLPEPGACAILCLGAVILASRRKRRR